jgi:hypothetical protein
LTFLNDNARTIGPEDTPTVRFSREYETITVSNYQIMLAHWNLHCEQFVNDTPTNDIVECDASKDVFGSVNDTALHEAGARTREVRRNSISAEYEVPSMNGADDETAVSAEALSVGESAAAEEQHSAIFPSPKKRMLAMSLSSPQSNTEIDGRQQTAVHGLLALGASMTRDAADCNSPYDSFHMIQHTEQPSHGSQIEDGVFNSGIIQPEDSPVMQIIVHDQRQIYPEIDGSIAVIRHERDIPFPSPRKTMQLLTYYRYRIAPWVTILSDS